MLRRITYNTPQDLKNKVVLNMTRLGKEDTIEKVLRPADKI
jgi:hypothetical protein